MSPGVGAMIAGRILPKDPPPDFESPEWIPFMSAASRTMGALLELHQCLMSGRRLSSDLPALQDYALLLDHLFYTYRTASPSNQDTLLSSPLYLVYQPAPATINGIGQWCAYLFVRPSNGHWTPRRVAVCGNANDSSILVHRWAEEVEWDLTSVFKGR